MEAFREFRVVLILPGGWRKIKLKATGDRTGIF